MYRIKKTRGVNIIAVVLMIITFFLVIGFAIGAMSTMNLNLAGRSVKVTQAEQIAEAAVAQFLYHIEEQTEAMNETVYLDGLSFPPMDLDEYYDGNRNIFEGTPNYIGERCLCKVSFVKSGLGDTYYSTDNSNNKESKEGALGMVPPFTIDLILTVHIGDFVKHYQVWINRKWDYAIYAGKGPVHLLSNIHQVPSTVIGNIYSGFNPVSTPAVIYPEEIICAMYRPDESSEYPKVTIIAENRIPPLSTYPAAITVGGKLLRKEEVLPAVITTITPPHCTANCLDGRGVYPYPPPTVFPAPELFVFPQNNEDKVKGSLFNMQVRSPFEKLVLVNDEDVTGIRRINEIQYPAEIALEENVYDDSHKLECVPQGSVSVSYIEGAGPPPDYTGKDLLYQDYLAAQAECDLHVKDVFFLKKSLTTIPDPLPEEWEWNDGAKFVLKEESPGDRYLPLTDRYKRCNCRWTENAVRVETAPGSGIWQVTETFSYQVVSEIYEIDPADNDLIVDNSMVLARSDVQLRNSDFKGDNTMLQVEGNLNMQTGQITAGEAVGAVIYCERFYCDSWGLFNGVILVDESMKVGGVKNPAKQLEVNGGVVVNGNAPTGDWDYFDTGGLVVSGFKVVYDPAYMRFLNRFGAFRIACWRELD